MTRFFALTLPLQALGLTGLLLLSSPMQINQVSAFPGEVPAAHTGGFGEPTCETCHFSDIRDASGVLSLSGLPGIWPDALLFRPGETYELSLSITETASRAGFQLSTRFAESSACKGCQAGELTPVNGVSRTSRNDISYLSHREASSWLRQNPPWTFIWTAPDTDEPVTLNLILNLADGDESPLGDQIYQAELTITPDVP